MKIRLKGNSVRIRLLRPEVARLGSGEPVEETSEFGPGQVLRYRVEAPVDASSIQTSFAGGAICVTIPPALACQWASSDDVGIYGNAGLMQVSVEKDFRCLTRPEERLNPEVYPHPQVDFDHPTSVAPLQQCLTSRVRSAHGQGRLY